MYYNEAYEERQKQEKALLTKWEKALNADGGIKDEHLARSTAILLENYLQYLHSDPRLIAEDRVQTNAFTGVNLALLGLIARVIPSLIGAELVGLQAMPTPKAPIFTIKWQKDDNKGRSSAGDELWETPVNFSEHEVGLDPHYSSQIVKQKALQSDLTGTTDDITLDWANKADAYTNSGAKPYIFPSTAYLTAYDADGNVLADYKAVGAYTAAVTFSFVAGSGIDVLDIANAGTTGATVKFDHAASSSEVEFTAGSTVTAWPDDDGTTNISYWIIKYEYKGEAEPNIPEMSFEITEETVELIRRQLRGKYTMDAAFDLKKLHGINLDSELANMMKVELQAEINREIVGDLRMLAAISEDLDYADFIGSSTGVAITGNYQDAHLVLLDAIDKIAAEIWVQGRLGRGNWVVGNPTTLAFLDRVPGFVGSGVSYNGKELAFLGSMGGKMKFYADPLYPKNELLIGYKGPGALDAGYIHAPYLPITATPTLLNPETGDPSKIFYTRYGKTFRMNGSTAENLILNGQYQYARLSVTNLPSPLNI